MKPLTLALLTACLLAAPAPAQNATGLNAISAQAPFLAAALSEFFSDTRALTAVVELTLPAPDGGEALKLPFAVAMADGKMRWELNLTTVKSATLPADALTGLKDFGLDRMFFLYQPGKPLTLGFPGMKSFVEMAVPKPEGVQQQAAEKIGRLEKKEMGRETIAGQPTVKYSVKIPGDDGTATVWQAPNLQNLPIKIAMSKGGKTYQLQLSNVRLGQPDPAYFTLPAGFAKHANLDAVFQAAALKSLGSITGGLK